VAGAALALVSGLRHDLSMVQKWLGHAVLSTTVISADADCAEAKHPTQRIWG